MKTIQFTKKGFNIIEIKNAIHRRDTKENNKYTKDIKSYDSDSNVDKKIFDGKGNILIKLHIKILSGCKH